MQHHAHLEQSSKLGMLPLFYTAFSSKVELPSPYNTGMPLYAVCSSAGCVLGSNVQY